MKNTEWNKNKTRHEGPQEFYLQCGARGALAWLLFFRVQSIHTTMMAGQNDGTSFFTYNSCYHHYSSGPLEGLHADFSSRLLPHVVAEVKW